MTKTKKTQRPKNQNDDANKTLEQIFAEVEKQEIRYGFGQLQIPDGRRDDRSVADDMYESDGIEKIEEA